MIYSWDILYIRGFYCHKEKQKVFVIIIFHDFIDFSYFLLDFLYIFTIMSMCGGAKIYKKDHLRVWGMVFFLKIILSCNFSRFLYTLINHLKLIIYNL